MTIRLLAVDVDDTLLDSQGKLLPSTRKAVAACLEQGIKVVLCSGRPLAGLTPYLQALNISGSQQYAITYNGAIIEAVAGDIISKKLVNNQWYRQLTAFSQEHKIPFNVVAPDSQIYTADHDVNWLTVVQAWENSAGVFIRKPDELPADFVIAKGLFVGDSSLLDQIEPTVEQVFGQDLSVVRSGPNFLEVMHLGVNKGVALQQLAQHLNLSAAEVMAVGDEKNDLPMFEFAGTAVAMGNGTDLAKQHADFVTGTNDEDGLAAAIEKYALN